MSKVLKERWEDSERRERTSKRTKDQWQDPEFRELMSKSNKERWEDPEYREKRSKATKELWENPEYGEKVSKGLKEHWQDPELREKASKVLKKQWQDFEYREKMSGENSHLWKGGMSFEPYSPDFNNELKEKIRFRDDYTCQLCGIDQEGLGQKMDVHHRDYNKKNNEPENLITLCLSCHGKTNYDRDYWESFLMNIVSSRGVVSK